MRGLSPTPGAVNRDAIGPVRDPSLAARDPARGRRRGVSDERAGGPAPLPRAAALAMPLQPDDEAPGADLAHGAVARGPGRDPDRSTARHPGGPVLHSQPDAAAPAGLTADPGASRRRRPPLSGLRGPQ